MLARNAVGSSTASSPSNAVSPVGPPARPLAPAVVRGDRSVTVQWSAPTNNGSPISAYVVTTWPVGKTLQVSGSSRSAVVTGLMNGAAYRFTVTAKNAAGSSPASPLSASVAPAGVPTRVAKPSVAVRRHKVTVNWTAVNGNGSHITKYVVYSSTGYRKVVEPSVRRYTFDRVRAGKHPFRVRACNAVGCSQPSLEATALFR